MKHFKSITVFIMVIFFGMAAFSQSQGFERLRKNRAQNITKRNFSIEKTRLIEGKITKVEKVNYGSYGATGIHLIVNEGKKGYRVIMGPQYFFNNKGIKFKTGDLIKLNTFEGTFKDQVVFYASNITTGKDVIQIRDKNGDPAWSQSRGLMNRSGRGRGQRRGGRGFKNR